MKITKSAIVTASDVPFDNSGTGLSATHVQLALEQLSYHHSLIAEETVTTSTIPHVENVNLKFTRIGDTVYIYGRITVVDSINHSTGSLFATINSTHLIPTKAQWFPVLSKKYGSNHGVGTRTITVNFRVQPTGALVLNVEKTPISSVNGDKFAVRINTSYRLR